MCMWHNSCSRTLIRLMRNFTDPIKDTWCEISVKCNLSTEVSRLVILLLVKTQLQI